MSLTHELVTLSSSTPTLLTVASADELPYTREIAVSIQNIDDTGFVFLGGSSVSTSSYGFRIDPGQTFTATVQQEDDLYAVCDSGSFDVAVLRVVRHG